MRIERLRLTDYRAIAHAEVHFAPTGVTIIEGDNEVGKTSLTEAVDLVLAVRDDSKKEAVRNLQPYGRDVGPEVEIDVSTGQYRFTLRKRWLRRSETVLEVHAPEPEVLTGREAHERAQAILAETVDVALWSALRLQQGADAGGVGFDIPALGRALDRAAGGGRATEREDDLWARIVAERARYWTATGRPSTERTNLTERLAEAESELRTVEAELRQLQSHVDEMARLETDARDLAARQHDLDAKVAQLQERHAEVATLRNQVAHHEAEQRTASARHERWLSASEARRRLVASVDAHAERLAAAEAALAAAEPAAAAARKRAEELETEREGARLALGQAEVAHEIAQADLDHRRREIEVAQLRERHDRVAEQRAVQAAAEAVLEEVRVDAAAVAAIEAAEREVVRAEAAAAAGAATVDIEALADTIVEVDGRAHELAAGAHLARPVPGEATVVLPGIVQLRVRGGAEAQVLADRLTEAEAELAGCCVRWGVADLAEARAAASRRTAAEQALQQAKEWIRADLRDLSIDDLAGKVERLTARIDAYRATRATTPPLPEDLDAAQAREAEASAALGAARRAAADADEAVASAAASGRQREVTHAGLAAEVRLEREALAAAELSLEGARTESSDAELAEAVALAGAELEAASTQLSMAEASLRRLDPDTLEVLLANARSAQRRGSEELAANRDARRDLETVLETKGEQGLAERRDRAATALERLRLERDRLEARATAALTLHDAFERRRAEAHARYLAPFREEIERLGRVVFGPSLEIELSPDLRIATRTLDGVRLPFDQLSAGAREQLGILGRLACASIVAGDEGAPVVLDDTLGWADPTRLSQMAAAIGVAGRSCQIVLLTCTPGRFAHVGAASVVRLPGAAEPGGADRQSA